MFRPQLSFPRLSRCAAVLSLALSAAVAPLAFGQTTPPSDPNQGQAGQSSSGQNQTDPNAPTINTGRTTRSRSITDVSGTKLALSAPANYKNKYEVFGGVNFMNFQAGQNLPKRMNFGGAEGEVTYWLTPKLGATGDVRFEGGSTPIFPNNYYNRVAVFQYNFLGGVTYRGPKNHYAAVDFHGLAGGSHGIFDHAIQNYPGGSPISATGIGLYSNRTAFMAALGGSVDFNYTRNIAFRLQPDLILEHYGTELREFVSVSGGILYRWGKR